METRQPYSNDEICKRRIQRSKLEADGKPIPVTVHDKTGNCKPKPYKSMLLVAVVTTLIVITYSILGHHRNDNYIPHAISMWKWGGRIDQRYISQLKINWDDVSSVIHTLSSKKQIHGIGFLNFHETEIIDWKTRIAVVNEDQIVHLKLDPVDQNVTWDVLYPEWIDEEQEEEVPTCPNLPKLDVPRKVLDLIVVKLPCRNEGNWSRDVARLHLQLAAAGLAGSSRLNRPVHFLFVTNCFPIPNLFPCKELVVRRGEVWLYEPDLKVLREKVQLPVGSCELALPFKPRG
ncbi:hypothetical protein Hdeb2414_s0002g00062131 [Helianthus debilis subsp. tardiflorus]